MPTIYYLNVPFALQLRDIHHANDNNERWDDGAKLILWGEL